MSLEFVVPNREIGRVERLFKMRLSSFLRMEARTLLFALLLLVIHVSAEVPDPTITEAPSTFELVARQNSRSSNFLGFTVDSTGGCELTPGRHQRDRDMGTNRPE
jgi:hypothetical protein